MKQAQVLTKEELKTRKATQKEELRFQKEIQRVLGIYEERGPIWGMGAAGAVLLILALIFSSTWDLARFDSPQFVITVLLVLVGVTLVVLSSFFYNREKERTSSMRKIIIQKAVENDKLLARLVEQFSPRGKSREEEISSPNQETDLIGD